ncbi:hypothetical protein VULLAG_LOCUS19831 [Vulpes lagopus]
MVKKFHFSRDDECDVVNRINEEPFQVVGTCPEVRKSVTPGASAGGYRPPSPCLEDGAPSGPRQVVLNPQSKLLGRIDRMYDVC